MSGRQPTGQEQTPASAHGAVRSAVRFPLELPVTLSVGEQSVAAQTIDVSSTGVLFATDAPFETGTVVQWRMLLPSAVMGTQHDIAVDCAGRVVWSQDVKPTRVAVMIDEYRIEEESR